MPRPSRFPKNAQKTTIYFLPATTVALRQIEALRQHREERGDSPSEIIADAIWLYLEQKENIPREEIEKRFPKTLEEQKKPKITRFPKNTPPGSEVK